MYICTAGGGRGSVCGNGKGREEREEEGIIGRHTRRDAAVGEGRRAGYG